MDELQMLDTLETVVKVAMCDCDKQDLGVLRTLLDALRDVRGCINK